MCTKEVSRDFSVLEEDKKWDEVNKTWGRTEEGLLKTVSEVCG